MVLFSINQKINEIDRRTESVLKEGKKYMNRTKRLKTIKQKISSRIKLAALISYGDYILAPKHSLRSLGSDRQFQSLTPSDRKKGL